MLNLPPILAHDYCRNKLRPFLRIAMLMGSLLLIALVTFGYADGRPLIIRDADGFAVAVGTNDAKTELGVAKFNAHLDDDELAKIREACR